MRSQFSSSLRTPARPGADESIPEEAETTVLSQPQPADEAPADLGTIERDEREAIAEQPTEFFDVASELAREHGESSEAEAGYEGTAAEAEAQAPQAPSEAEVDEVTQAEEAAEVQPELEQPEEPTAVEHELPVEADLPAAPAEDIVEPITDDAAAPEPPAEPELGPATTEEPFDERSLSDELDEALETPEVERRAAFFDDETDEYRTPQRPSRQTSGDEPSPSGDSDEDVLEDTPDFLEETPEHDRLWFEQKPPKDFDFND